jgi:cytochrome c oxidase subunit I
VTTLADRPAEQPPVVTAPPRRPASGLLDWITTTDHKKIGILYIFTAFGFFLVGGGLAEAMRTQLARPEQHLISADTYNQLFTMHGSIMMFLFIGPMAFGFANYFVPLQIGAPDLSFPRLNALAYWLYLGGGLTMVSGFLTDRGAANFGWFAYAPLSNQIHTPGAGADLWIVGVALTGVAGTLFGVNLITTILTLRTPGMTMLRMPFFCWDMLVTSFLVVLTFPVVAGAVSLLFADRNFGAHFFDATKGGEPILWQHLFWFFGHPEVYIIVLPYFGIVTDVIAVFSRKPIFGYIGMLLATFAIAGLSTGVWAHHMFATGDVLLPFFSGLSFLIAVPTGVKFVNWIGTMWGGRITFETPMLFCIGFLLMFVMGGVTGVMLASPPIDFHVTDTYFVVAHMHYVMFGGSTFAMFAGIYYWFPKMFGRKLSEPLGKLHFWLLLIGFNLTFFPQHILGLRGMQRRIVTYPKDAHWSFLNLMSSIGAWIMGVAILIFLWNVFVSLRRGAPAGDDPWQANTLEWYTTSPPPEHNFTSLPPIRSDRPLFDLRHPELAHAEVAAGAAPDVDTSAMRQDLPRED